MCERAGGTYGVVVDDLHGVRLCLRRRNSGLAKNSRFSPLILRAGLLPSAAISAVYFFSLSSAKPTCKCLSYKTCGPSKAEFSQIAPQLSRPLIKPCYPRPDAPCQWSCPVQHSWSHGSLQFRNFYLRKRDYRCMLLQHDARLPMRTRQHPNLGSGCEASQRYPSWGQVRGEA